MKTKLTKHFFSVKIAEKYDIECAVIFENLLYWIEKNKANGNNEHEGLYWTYNSMPAFQKLFPYLSEHKIRRVLKKLEKENVITTGNFNKTAYDRTKWYAITEYGYSILKNSQMQTKEPSDSIPKKPQMEISKTADGNTKNRRPIPNSKPNNNLDSKPNKENTVKSKIFLTSFQKDIFNKFWFYLETKHPHSYKQYQKKKNRMETNWGETINWLLDNTKDTYSESEIYNAIKNATIDNFWSKQFRSINKLKQTDKEGTRYIAKFLDLGEQNKSEVDRYLEGV